MSPKETAYYDLLGVSSSATQAEIRKAYRLKALLLHPDRAGNSKEATEAFQHLKAVHDLLSDPERRAIYDEQGDLGGLHHDDDSPFDLSSTAAFFGAHVNRVTPQDIAAYEKQYRNGSDEKEDLFKFFNRFNGNVRLVLEYIPYSEECDLTRFVHVWDEAIKNKDIQLNDDSSCNWEKARQHLLDISKGKERPPIEEETLVDSDDEQKGKKKSTGGRSSKSKAKPKRDNDTSDLVALIQARRQRGQEQFDRWAASIEAESLKEGSKKSKKKTKSKQKKNESGSKAKLKPSDRVSKRKC